MIVRVAPDRNNRRRRGRTPLVVGKQLLAASAGLLLALAALLAAPLLGAGGLAHAQAAVPGAPTGLTATAVGETTINLAWTAPADNGGDAIIGYQIEVWVAGGMHWAVLKDDTESAGTDYAHTGLMDGRTRYYRVSAINSEGAGAVSNVASASATDMMAPRFSGNAGDTGVTVNGTDLLLQFDESLDRGAGRTPPASAFTVTAGGVAIAVDGVYVEGSVVRLALDGAITKSQSVTVSYSDPTGGDDTAAIQDYAGNDTESFAGHAISSGRNKSVVLAAPTNLTATAASTTQIDLSWEAPAGFTPTGYRIEVSADGGTTWTDRVANTESTATAYSHTGLTLGDTRHYRVSAISGTSPALASNVASATAVDPTDSTPPTIVGASTHFDRLLVDASEQLDESPDRAPPASAFTVTADGAPIAVESVLVEGVFVGLLGLDPEITIGQTVKVSYRDPTGGDDQAAIQDYAGNDAASFTDYPVSNSSALRGPPTNLTATGVSATQIDLSWEAPSGFTPEGYKIEVSADGGTTWTDRVPNTGSTATAYSHTGLTLGDTRHYRVSAIDSGGLIEGLPSNIATATAVDPTDSTPPTIVGASTHFDRLLVDASEQLDESPDRAPPASAFTVTADGAPIAVESVLVEGVFVGLLGLDPEITIGQTVKVSYRDPTGGDDQAAIQDYAGNDAASFTDYPVSNSSALRGPPTNLTATGVSATQIDLSWEAPSGFTPEGYKIEVSADGGTTWTDRVPNTGSTATAYSHTGLTLGATRHYRVSAIDSGGLIEGLPSNIATATAVDPTDSTPPTIVGASTHFDRLLVDASEQLDESPDRAPPASAFTVTADGAPIAVESVLVEGVFVGLLGLDPEITIGQTVKVSYRDPTGGDDQAAIQDYAGNDAASFTDYPVSNSSALRGPPTNLTATGVSATQIDLSWEAPSGFTPEGYKIEVSADGGTTWTDRVPNTGSTATAYSHTGLTLGATRHYRVSAIDSGGLIEGLPSNIAGATAADTTDSTGPTFSSAAVPASGDRVSIEMNEYLDENPDHFPPADAFTVTTAGVVITPATAAVDDDTVTLSDLGATITKGQEVTVSYRDPSGGDDATVLQDLAGNDAASFAIQPVTNDSGILGPPTNLRATKRSFNETDLSWEAPDGYTPDGYRVEGNNNDPNLWTTLVNEVDDPTDTVFSHFVHVPDPLYPYRYRVWAVSSTVESVVSNTAAAGPDRVPPVLVPEHRDTSVLGDGTAISLEFTEKLVYGPPWSAFTVTVDGIPVQQGRVTTAQDQIRLTGFESPIGGGRVVRVSYRDPTPGDDPAAIQDAAGNDAASFTDVVVKNSSRVLPAPTNLRAAGLDDTRIGLDWNAPDLSGLVWPEHIPGAGIYGYKIEASADGGETWTTVVSTSNRNTDYIHTGLAHGDVRHYRVSALNPTFAGLPSNVAGAIASDTSPPGLKSAATNEAGTVVTLEFDTTLQSGTGETSPASTFTVTADGVAMTAGTATTGTDTIVLSELSPAIRQGQTVTASYRDLTEGDDESAIQDEAGNDAESFTDYAVTNNSTVTPTAPGAPASLTAQTGSDTRIDLSWEAPEDNGGRPIEGYRIEVSTDGGNNWTDLVADTGSIATAYAHTELGHGVTRHYRVLAINAIGASLASTTASATTLDDMTPPSLTAAAVESAGTQVTLTFDEILDDTPARTPPASAFGVTVDGAPVTVGAVRVEGNVKRVLLQSLSGVIRQGQTATVTYTDPTGGDDTAALQDAAGHDVATFTADATNNSTVSPVVPSKPTGLTATAVGSSRIDLAWTAPADNGGRAISGYRIEVSPDGSTDWSDVEASTGNAATTYSHRDLVPDTPHHYRVSAINEIGTSDLSDTASATSGPPADVTVSFDKAEHSAGEGGHATVTLELDKAPGYELTIPLVFAYEGGASADDIEPLWSIWDGEIDREGTALDTASPSVVFGEDNTMIAIRIKIVEDGAVEVGEVVKLGLGALPAAVATGAIGLITVAIHNDDGFAAAFPDSAYQSQRHTGTGDSPQVVVAFSEPVAAFDKDTPSVSATSAGIRSVAAFDKEGLANAYVFYLAPEGRERIEFQLSVSKPCADGGICTTGGRMLEAVPAGGARTVEGPVGVSVADAGATVAQDPTMDFTVTLDPGAIWGDVTVDYATEDGTAAAGADYTATSGTLTFKPRERELTVSVPIRYNAAAADGVTFTLALSNAVEWTGPAEENRRPVAAELLDAEATGTISNATARARTVWSARMEVVDFGQGNIGADRFSNVVGTGEIEVGELWYDSAERKVYLRLTHYLADSEDFTLHAGGLALGLPAGGAGFAWTGVDVDWAVGETVAVWIAHPRGGARPGGPQLSVADAEATEGEDAALQFAVTLSEAASGTVTVDYATADGTATGGDDYTATSGSLTFEPGDTEKTIAVPIADDTVEDGRETVTLTLSNPVGATIDDGEATGAILNSGAPPELTASFEDLPEEHDGEGAFTFRVVFSEDIEISLKTSRGESSRGESFTVTEGNVTGARRVDGRHDLWEITVEPGSRKAVTVTLPGNRACGTAGAVCTRGDDPRPLSNSPSGTVAGPPTDPLTASFSDMPGEHTGDAFTFRLTFSEEPAVSYRTLRDEAFDVTGGAVRKAKRRQSGSNVGWTITVEPDSDGAVTITLPATSSCSATGAICTEDGRALSHSSQATVAGPVGDARAEETAGAVLDDSHDEGEETLTSEAAAADPDAPTEPPNAPRTVRITGDTKRSLTLSWEAPDGGAEVAEYRVRWLTLDEDFASAHRDGREAVVDASARSHKITGLAKGGFYQVLVVAVNAEGESEASNTAWGFPGEGGYGHG